MIIKEVVILVFIDLEKLGQSYTFTALCGIITIIGFIITIVVFFRTKSIERKLEEYKVIKEYNKIRGKLRRSFLEYRDAIQEDNAEIYKIKSNILDDLNAFNENYRITCKLRQKANIRLLIRHLQRSKRHNKNWICNQLSKISSYLYLEKEDVL